MSVADPYRLPAPLPRRSYCLGSAPWGAVFDTDGRPVPLLADFRVLGSALSEAAPPEAEEPTLPVPCVFLHAGYLQLASRSAEVASDIAALVAANPGVLVVLIGDRLPLQTCARLFQAGLFDALEVPLARSDWDEFCQRIEARRQLAADRAAVRRQVDETNRRLHAHRRELQDQVARVGEELVHAQQRLERANRELSLHVAQISLLYRLGRELSTARNWDTTLERFLACLADFLGAGGAALVLRPSPGAPFRPRRTYRWEETAWDRVLLRIEERIRNVVAARVGGAAVFVLPEEGGSAVSGERRITALPLEHQGLRLGYLLLLGLPGRGPGEDERDLPFLQAVQVILAEEVAAAQTLDRLRELGTFNARVLDTVRSGIWVLDQEGRTVYCNRQAHLWLSGPDGPGAPRKAAPASCPSARPEIGRGRAARRARRFPPVFSGQASFPRSELPELLADGLLRLPGVDGPVVSALLGRGERPFRGEGRLVCPGGQTIPLLVQVTAMEGRGSEERWLVVVADDLRESKRLAAERSRADNLQSLVEMSAALAHEIRNPLTGLSNQAELLAGQLPQDDPRRRYLDVITGEVERINSTITRLLTYVRPYEPRLATADLQRLARDSLDLAMPRAASKRVNLALEVDPTAGGPMVWRQAVDAGQIKQVLLNLLFNAVDASPAGGHVRLALRHEAQLELTDVRSGSSRVTRGCVVEVSDEGPGFPASDAERIFQPFFTTKSTGTGLGLSICRKIVVAHGGEIEAARREGRTVFRVLLPSAATYAQRQEEA